MKTVLMVLALCLGGCNVTSDEWRIGEVACKHNGGIDYVTTDGFIECKNGARFGPSDSNKIQAMTQ